MLSRGVCIRCDNKVTQACPQPWSQERQVRDSGLNPSLESPLGTDGLGTAGLSCGQKGPCPSGVLCAGASSCPSAVAHLSLLRSSRICRYRLECCGGGGLTCDSGESSLCPRQAPGTGGIVYVASARPEQTFNVFPVGVGSGCKTHCLSKEGNPFSGC